MERPNENYSRVKKNSAKNLELLTTTISLTDSAAETYKAR